MSQEAKRQIKIKTSASKRLFKEIQHYVKELTQNEAKAERLREEKADKHDIKKAQEFVSESAAVLTDARGRASKALGELRGYIDTVAAELDGTEELADANKTADDLEGLLDGRIQPESPSPAASAASRPLPSSSPSVDVDSFTGSTVIVPHSNATAATDKAVSAANKILETKEAPGTLKVAVYGSSRCKDGDELYTMAEKLGAELGKRGMHVITGGYMGTMEAVSRGAASTPGVVVEGIISPSTFPHRGNKGNAHVNLFTEADSLQDRICLFTKKADAFVVLPGNVGTLTEFTLTWNVSMVNGFSGKPPYHIFAWKEPWGKFLDFITPLIGVPESDIKLVTLVDGVDDCVAKLEALQKQKQQS